MSVKIWRFASIYLTALTLSLTFSHLLEMPRKLAWRPELYRDVHHKQQALREILRALTPGGRLLFVEHIAAPHRSRLRRIQNLITPIWKRLGMDVIQTRDLEGIGTRRIRPGQL
jgi:SAM-dependent methyltransferase